jgi:hypothetical protein
MLGKSAKVRYIFRLCPARGRDRPASAVIGCRSYRTYAAIGLDGVSRALLQLKEIMERLLVGFVGAIRPPCEVAPHLSPPITFEEAMRRAIFYDDNGNWRHRLMNRLLARLVDFSD